MFDRMDCGVVFDEGIYVVLLYKSRCSSDSLDIFLFSFFFLFLLPACILGIITILNTSVNVEITQKRKE